MDHHNIVLREATRSQHYKCEYCLYNSVLLTLF